MLEDQLSRAKRTNAPSLGSAPAIRKLALFCASYIAWIMIGPARAQTITDLGTLGGTFSTATAVSANGSVIVGGSYTSGGDYHAFKYVGSTMTDLGTLGGTFSNANAVSADGGVIVGDSITHSGNTHAFKYVGSTMTDLGTLGGAYSEARAVSADGGVIVGSATNSSGNWRAFAYAEPVIQPPSGGSGGVMIDILNTYSALLHNSYQLNSVLNLQNSQLGMGLAHDCNLFGANNICVAAGGSYINSNKATASDTAANVRVAYRALPQVRVGVFLDQSLSNSMPNNYSVKNGGPMAGVFAGWSQTDQDLGAQVKASLAYSSQGATISRTTMSNTEAGSGNSRFTGQGALAEAAYGLGLNEQFVAQPFVGVRYTKVSRNSYGENGTVAFPIYYDTVNQQTTTGYAGARLIAKVTPQITLKASAGVEQDLKHSIDNYSGSIYFLGSFNLGAAQTQKTRGFAQVGADYQVDKSQRINVSAFANQQQLNNSTAVAGMVSYVVGF